MNSSSDSGLAASGWQGAHAVVFSLARLRRARLTLLTRRRLLNPGDQFCQALHDQARGGPAKRRLHLPTEAKPSAVGRAGGTAFVAAIRGHRGRETVALHQLAPAQ